MPKPRHQRRSRQRQALARQLQGQGAHVPPPRVTPNPFDDLRVRPEDARSVREVASGG